MVGDSPKCASAEDVDPTRWSAPDQNSKSGRRYPRGGRPAGRVPALAQRARHVLGTPSRPVGVWPVLQLVEVVRVRGALERIGQYVGHGRFDRGDSSESRGRLVTFREPGPSPLEAPSRCRPGRLTWQTSRSRHVSDPGQVPAPRSRRGGKPRSHRGTPPPPRCRGRRGRRRMRHPGPDGRRTRLHRGRRTRPVRAAAAQARAGHAADGRPRVPILRPLPRHPGHRSRRALACLGVLHAAGPRPADRRHLPLRVARETQETADHRPRHPNTPSATTTGSVQCSR
jgi:hypothetical protein